MVAKYVESYTFVSRSLRTHGLVVKASHNGLEHGLESSSVLKLSAVPWPFCVALSPSDYALTLALLYCCTHYNFFPSKFVNGDLALTGV